MRLPAFVCLSVCLLARLLKNACMDLGEMLRVDRLLSPIRIIVRMPKPDCFLRYRISHATRNFTSGKSDVYALVSAAKRGFKLVLRPTAAATRDFTMVSFTEPVSRRNTFVGGTCAPPSALLVSQRSSTRWQKNTHTHIYYNGIIIESCIHSTKRCNFK